MMLAMATKRAKAVPNRSVKSDRVSEGRMRMLAQRVVALEDELLRTQAEHKNEKRRAYELFLVIEQVIKQRDEYKQLYFDNLEKAHNGQALLENVIGDLRRLVLALVRECNENRRASGKPELAPPFAGILDAPIGLSLRFHERSAQLAKARDAGEEKPLEMRKKASEEDPKTGEPWIERWTGPEVDAVARRDAIMRTEAEPAPSVPSEPG
jgi:hypothetical protein